MREYVAYIIDTEFAWGYQTNVAGLSKTPPSFTYPPPTTFLGALTEAIARREGLGESSYVRLLNELITDLVAIAIKPRNIYPLKTLDINRVIAVKEAAGTTFPDPDEPGRSFDAPARGKTIASPLGGPPTITWVLVWVRKPSVLREKDLWRIHRLGTKESIVSVTQVKKEAATPSDSDVVTNYSVPLSVVKSFRPKIGSEWVIESYADPFKPFKKGSPATRYVEGDTIPFALPVNRGGLATSAATVEVGDEGAAYLVGRDPVVGVVKE